MRMRSDRYYDNLYVVVFPRWKAVQTGFSGESIEPYAPGMTWHIVGRLPRSLVIVCFWRRHELRQLWYTSKYASTTFGLFSFFPWDIPQLQSD